MTTKAKPDHGEINGSPVRVVYRVQNGEARLFVTRDDKIWIGYGESPERFSHVANVGGRDTEGTAKAAICRAANCW